MIDAILPVTANDIPRLRCLIRSLTSNFQGLNKCFIVVPDSQLPNFFSLSSDTYIVLPESCIIGTSPALQNTSGWYKQQLVKLLGHRIVSTDFYLTLDADVLCLKKVSSEDLIQNGKAIYRRTIKNYHPEWYDWATRVLKCERPQYTHGVTPAILSRHAMCKMLDRIAHQHMPFKERIKYEIKHAGFHRRPPTLTDILLSHLPWTEYSLYGTYLEATHSFEQYHYDGGEYAIYHCSVWNAEQLLSWSAEDFFETQGNHYFCVLQSTANIPIELHEEITRNYT